MVVAVVKGEEALVVVVAKGEEALVVAVEKGEPPLVAAVAKGEAALAVVVAEAPKNSPGGAAVAGLVSPVSGLVDLALGAGEAVLALDSCGVADLDLILVNTDVSGVADLALVVSGWTGGALGWAAGSGVEAARPVGVAAGLMGVREKLVMPPLGKVEEVGKDEVVEVGKEDARPNAGFGIVGA